MTLQALAGQCYIGPNVHLSSGSIVSATGIALDAAEEAYIAVGTMVTSDGLSHTLNTTGSSSIGWRANAVTFANAGTTLKVGIAPPDAATGPPARAANTTNVIDFDVSAAFTGGGGFATGYQTSVPTAGTKTIAHGDQVAIAVQMTARAGADTVLVHHRFGATSFNSPAVTSYIGATYAAVSALPNFFITFADGATGYLLNSDVFSTISTRTWNSTNSPSEYGQLFVFPVPATIIGVHYFVAAAADHDLVLYSDPLGTPVPERTRSIDANVVQLASARQGLYLFATPYNVTAGQTIAAVMKPGASNSSLYFKTLANAAHRTPDVGLSSYGVSRSGGTGAFANANSSLDHYHIGLILGGFDDGTRMLGHPGMAGGMNA